MPEPYDYSRAMPKMPDPFGSYARGADLGYGIQQRELQTQQQELEIQQQQVELANQRAAAKRRIDMQDAIAGLMNNKSPSAIMHVMTEYPEIIQNLKPLFDEYTTQELQQKISTATPIYAALLSNRPDLAADIYEQQAIAAENSGDNERAAIARAKAEQVVKFPNVAMTELGITMATAMGPNEFQKMFKSASAETQAFEDLIEGLSEEDKIRAIRIKLGLDARAVGSATTTLASSPQDEIDKVALVQAQLAASTENAILLERLNLEPQIKLAVEQSLGLSKAIIDREEGKRSNSKALRAYEASISSLATALGNTYTGIGGGLVSAFTVKGQIANASIALMAPILKDVFRGAGEGTFTKDDQEILMAMLPTLDMKPAARAASLAAVEAVVRAKLSVPEVDIGAYGVKTGQQLETGTQGEATFNGFRLVNRRPGTQ